MIEVGQEFRTIARNVCANCGQPIELALYTDGTEQWFHEQGGGWHFCRDRIATPVAGEAQPQPQEFVPDVSRALAHHWQTHITWGGERREACGRCRHGDGVNFLWPCPTVQALTGAAEPDPRPLAAAVGVVPVPQQQEEQPEKAGNE